MKFRFSQYIYINPESNFYKVNYFIVCNSLACWPNIRILLLSSHAFYIRAIVTYRLCFLWISYQMDDLQCCLPYVFFFCREWSSYSPLSSEKRRHHLWTNNHQKEAKQIKYKRYVCFYLSSSWSSSTAIVPNDDKLLMQISLSSQDNSQDLFQITSGS